MTKMVDYEAICIKTTPFRETDVIAAFYTREGGLIRSVARGVKASKSKLSGACVPMTLNAIQLKPSRQLYSLLTYQRLSSFEYIQTHLTAVGIAGTFLEIIYHLGQDTDSVAIFDLLLAVLNNLNVLFYDKTTQPIEWILQTTQAHRILLETIGYGHSWENCIHCHTTLAIEEVSSLVFSPQAGGFFCANCYALQSELFLREKVRVSQQTIQLFLGHVPANLKLDVGAIEKCFRFLSYYWQFRLERPLHSFEVLQSLLVTNNFHDSGHTAIAGYPG